MSPPHACDKTEYGPGFIIHFMCVIYLVTYVGTLIHPASHVGCS